jgi:hypothetical protein
MATAPATPFGGTRSVFERLGGPKAFSLRLQHPVAHDSDTQRFLLRPVDPNSRARRKPYATSKLEYSQSQASKKSRQNQRDQRQSGPRQSRSSSDSRSAISRVCADGFRTSLQPGPRTGLGLAGPRVRHACAAFRHSVSAFVSCPRQTIGCADFALIGKAFQM